MFLRHPIRKLLVLINQSSYLIYLCHDVFDREKETNTKQNRWDYVPFTFLVLFSQKNHGFIKVNKLSEKVVIPEEELNHFDVDGIENLEGSPRFAFINEECGNLKVVNDGGELAKDINQKKKSDVSQKPVDVHSVTNVGESISSITIYNIVNQLGKRDFSYGSVVNNLKDRKRFFHQMDRNLFDPIPARRILPCRI